MPFDLDFVKESHLFPLPWIKVKSNEEDMHKVGDLSLNKNLPRESPI